MTLFSKNLLVLAILLSSCGAGIKAFDSQGEDKISANVNLSSTLFLSSQSIEADSFTASISGCTSGLQYTFTSSSPISTAYLVEGDTSCIFTIEEFSIAGISFHTLVYDPTPGAYNTFTSSDGQKVYLVPQSEIPSPVTTNLPDLTATLIATDEGSPFQIDAPTPCEITITKLGVVKKSNTRFRVTIPSSYVVQSDRVALYPCGEATTNGGCKRKRKTSALTVNFGNRYRKAGPHTVEAVVETAWGEDLTCRLENVVIPTN